jgi:hypothetical protein
MTSPSSPVGPQIPPGPTWVGTEVWRRWTPQASEDEPVLGSAVDAFFAGDLPAGRAAEHWLKHHSLQNHPSTVTRLVILEGRVEGFYALCSAQVELRTSDRKKLGVEHPVQPAALIAWIAKRCDARIPGELLFRHALAVAQEVAASQGAVVIVADPFDGASELVWLAEPYNFRRSRSDVPGGRGLKRLWKPLFPKV